MEPGVDPRPRGDVSDPLTGRLLDGRYRIGSRIARGGMAAVYEATDTRLERTVAVKVMHSGLGDDEEFAARFVREARAAARLSHPNVVNVYDQGDDHGTVFLAMEYIPGHTLRDVIRKESPMSPARALALIEPVLSALAAAHRAGLIHRDIKPENVLIADDGRVKVADFGLAKAISTDTQHTVTGGVLIGTVSYLAPELVIDGRADARADVYAVGVVLFELLTGVKPHEGESPIQVAYKHVHEDVPPPSQEVPGIPPYVDALVARATTRDRAHRPADAAVLLHQLHRVSHALADVVADDPELTADLRPPVARRDDASNDTAPEPFDTGLLRQGRNPVASVSAAGEATTTIEWRPDSAGSTALLSGPAVPPARPRRSRRGPLVLVLSLLLVAGVAAGAYWFGVARYTSTPGVIGLTQGAAADRLESAGLDVEVGDKTYSETVKAGHVLSTDPEAGSRILDGGTVTVVVSLGKERYDVPRLRGGSLDDAQDALKGGSLGFGKAIEKYHEEVPAGTVLGSIPAAGTTLRPDSAVDVVVSRGPKPIKVPDVTGKDADRAVQALEKRDLVVDRSDEFSDDVPEGDVISQSPTSGTLFRGDRVELVVSSGPELVEIPSGLIASGVDAARSKLEAAGFEVDVENAIEYLGLGFVFRVSPGSGDTVPKGSTVTLYII